MEWIKGIQRAIDYIELNLMEDMNYEDIAKQAYSSQFHFQRIFSIICGFTVGDYIRMRRLSVAASDLIRNNDKVIDVALRYGYDTPESFTRAFTNFHGATPTEAKRGKSVKSFSRLSVKLILTGGSTMDYRIEKLEDFKVICKRKQVFKQDGMTATPDISAFWSECMENGTTQKLAEYIPENPNLKGLLGICFSGIVEENEFPYGIGCEYDGRPVNDSDFEIVDIPASTYAVFIIKGNMPDVFPETYKKIFTEFFPQSDKYEYGRGIEIEVYPSADVDNPNYVCEVWIAVNEVK